MKYIQGIKTQGCFLCAMFKSRKDRENLVIWRGAACAIVMNRFPYNGGHLMVAPYRHVGGTQAMTETELLDMMRLTNLALDALQRVCRPDGFNVGINLGEAAGAGLKDHVHTHIVPRWNGDTNFMPVLADVKVMPQTLEEMRDILAAAITQPPARRAKKARR